VSKAINIETFIPYELDDIGVIIPHSSLYPKRWEWFWPRYKAATPPEILKNTVVIYHHQGNEMLEAPQGVRDIKEIGATLGYVVTEDRDLTEATSLGLELCRSRVVVRIQDDTGLEKNWAERVLDVFNTTPHIKIMGNVVALGPLYDTVKDNLCATWQHKLLDYGDYNWIAFLCGNAIAANRCVWKGYYPFVAEVKRFEQEDFYFTLFAMADGIPIEKWCPWRHCGGRRWQDEISDGCHELYLLEEQ